MKKRKRKIFILKRSELTLRRGVKSIIGQIIYKSGKNGEQSRQMNEICGVLG